MSLTPRRAYTECRFGHLHYMIATPERASAPPILLLHQNPSSIEEYRRLAMDLARDRRVLAFDTPGAGMSDRPPGPVSMTEYAAAFADGLDALKAAEGGKLDVFGYHTGTYLAVELALARPDLIGRVILSGIPFRPAEQRAPRLAAARTPMVLDDEGTALLLFLRDMWTYTVGGRHAETPIERAVEIYAERVRGMHRASWPYVAVWSYDAEARLPGLTQPALLLQPHEALLDYSRAAAALIPRIHIVEMPHLNSDVFESGAADFAREIRAWVPAI